MIIADYVADCVVRDARRFEKCNWCGLPGPGWRQHDDNQKGNILFVDAVEERSYLAG